MSLSRVIPTWRSRSRVINFPDHPWLRLRAGKTNATTDGWASGVIARAPRPFFSHSRFTPRGPRMGERRRHTTAHDTTATRDTRHEDRGNLDRKDTCCTARWVAVSGLCDSLSSVRICLSPSSCGCHAIFMFVFFNSTTVTRSLPSLTSQINGSSLQRSLSLSRSFFLSLPCRRSANPSPSTESSVRIVVAQGGATPFFRAWESGETPLFPFHVLLLVRLFGKIR